MAAAVLSGSAAVLFASALGQGAEPAAPATPPPTVVVLRPAKADEITTEALVRVQGELEAAGFDVDVLPFEGKDAKDDIETAGQDRNPVAAFALFVYPNGANGQRAEIWISDRVRQKTVIQRAALTEADAGRNSAVLAVRAVELLKVNLAGFWALPPTPPLPAPPPAAPPPAPAPPRDIVPRPRVPFAAGLGAGVGVGVVESFASMGATWAPDASLSYGWSDGLSVRASFLGLGPGVTLASSLGSARVDELLAMVDLVKTWWPRSPAVPFLVASAGAQHVHVVGSAEAPYIAHNADEWSFAAAAGAGLGVPVVATLSVVVQARAFAAWPPTTVNVADAEVGKAGAPSLLVDGALFGVLP
ncbi:MAG TPA: hypothetical protein VGM06_00800 [Polyangiaceae bacterium]